MSELTIKIGENIKEFRKRAKLKQYDLAKSLEINNITMSKIEKGSEALKVVTIEKAAKELGVQFEQIVFGEDAIVLNDSIIKKLRG